MEANGTLYAPEHFYSYEFASASRALPESNAFSCNEYWDKNSDSRGCSFDAGIIMQCRGGPRSIVAISRSELATMR